MQAHYITELTEQNFQPVLMGSQEKPVLVYFWAPMSPESKALIPLLQNITHSYAGELTLALLNCEQEQQLASQFGVATIPMMALFSQGRMIDGLDGPQNEEAIITMLNSHLPSRDENIFKQALELIEQKQYALAISQLKSLEPSMGTLGAYKIALAHCYIETQQFDLADSLLSTVLMHEQDAQYKVLIAKIELYKQAADTQEIRDLQQTYQADPSDTALAYKLALQYSQVSRQEEALELLIVLLRADLNAIEGDAKKTMIDILASLGQESELASRYRRQLYSLLY